MEKHQSRDDTKETDDPIGSTHQQTEVILGVISYIGLLWIIPLVLRRRDSFSRFHARQGFNLFVLELVVSAIIVIPVLGWIVGAIGWVISVVLAVIGLFNAVRYKEKRLPLIGKYQVLP